MTRLLCLSKMGMSVSWWVCDAWDFARSVPGSWNLLHSIHLNILERTCCDRHISWIMLLVSHNKYFLYFFMNWTQGLQDETYTYISYCNEKSFKLVYSLYRNVNVAICFNIWLLKLHVLNTCREFTTGELLQLWKPIMSLLCWLKHILMVVIDRGTLRTHNRQD